MLISKVINSSKIFLDKIIINNKKSILIKFMETEQLIITPKENTCRCSGYEWTMIILMTLLVISNMLILVVCALSFQELNVQMRGFLGFIKPEIETALGDMSTISGALGLFQSCLTSIGFCNEK